MSPVRRDDCWGGSCTAAPRNRGENRGGSTTATPTYDYFSRPSEAQNPGSAENDIALMARAIGGTRPN